MGIQKVRTSPYHAQTNGQVERAHQMLICMIGKLSRDWKVDWPKHLLHLLTTLMRFAITRRSPLTLPNYLMSRCQPCLPIDFYFPMMRGMEKHWCLNCYIAKLHEQLQEAFYEVQVQSTSEALRQK